MLLVTAVASVGDCPAGKRRDTFIVAACSHRMLCCLAPAHIAVAPRKAARRGSTFNNERLSEAAMTAVTASGLPHALLRERDSSVQ